MAEVFNNYLTSNNYGLNTSLIIVPRANESLSGGEAVSGSRENNSTVQLHSIYVTQNIESITPTDAANYRENPLNYAAYITLSVEDTGDSSNIKRYVIVNNAAVLPLSAFYIEKTITLKAQDRLVLTYTAANGAAKKLHTVCSGVEVI